MIQWHSDAAFLAILDLEKRRELRKKLEAETIFLLCFLLYAEAGFHEASKQQVLSSLAEISKNAGMRNAKVAKAIDELESLGVVFWGLGRYRLEPQMVTNLFNCYLGSDCTETPKHRAVALAICRAFFKETTRKTEIGRMDWLDKLLILSLAVSSNEYFQILGFDTEAWAHWLSIDHSTLMRRLEGLQAVDGFVLHIARKSRLESGLSHQHSIVVLNPAHPWLMEESRFYGFCQMHDATAYIELKKESCSETCNAEALGEMDKRKQEMAVYLDEDIASFASFEAHMDHYGYHVKLAEYGRHVSSLTKAEQISRWGSNAKQAQWCSQRFNKAFFEDCLSIGLDVLREATFTAKTITAMPIRNMMDKRPLFKELIDSQGLSSVESVDHRFKLIYLEQLYNGSWWVAERLLELCQKALLAHPEKDVVDGQLAVRFLHYATYPRILGAKKTQKATIGPKKRDSALRLTSMLFLHVDSRSYPAVWVQSTPVADERISKGLWYFKYNNKEEVHIRDYYPHCFNIAWAVIHELRQLQPAKVKSKRQSLRQRADITINGWIDYLRYSNKIYNQ